MKITRKERIETMAETGHAKNVANFESMVSFVTGYGGDYKPGNAEIQLGQLSAARSLSCNAFQRS